ncbi:HpcH/HpaI aldolase/citrate lyase family protein [Paenibacillus sp. YYML68]|uniref:HpcH/HpaI aldolase family protein n=1 Tax=Paenibacillus sp. YYML68 TaxID=2909250 RepID=UPI0024902B27|nr:aldolase/citrate lyase family protein [Paenibacillus sp. YYML68]
MTNLTKKTLEMGLTTYGVFLLTSNSVVSEIFALSDFQWVVMDMEASTASKKDIMLMLQSMNGSTVSPFVRVPNLEKHIIESVLDIGCSGVLVPKINNAKEAALAVEACFYPPKGTRGINPVRASKYFHNIEKYLRISNRETLCMVQIESQEGVENAHNIATVDGVDVVFIGCGDLASSLGQPGVVTGEKMDNARRKVLLATLEAGKIPGIFAYSLELAEIYAKEGFKFIAVGNDIKFLQQAIKFNIDKIENFIR